MSIDLEHFSPLGRVGPLTRLARGFALELGDERFKAEVVRADILRLAISRAGAWDERPTFATVFETPAGVRWELEESRARVTLRTDELEHHVERDEFHVEVRRRDGTHVLQSGRDASGRSLAYQELNDAFAVVRAARAGDPILGLGEKTGPLNRRGRSYTLFNVDVLSPNVHRHHRLIGSEEPPYLYAAFFEASRSGAPVQRPLVFDFQDDARAAALDDEFLVGDALRVAPVLDAGAERRGVYLPHGSWFERHSGRLHDGGRTLEVHAPPGKMPLFLRGGCALPLWETAPPTTLGYAPERLELALVVPHEDARRTSVLYEDDGTSLAHRDGRYLLTRIELERRGSALRVHGTTTGARFDGFARRELALTFRGLVPKHVRLNGRPVTLTHGALTFPHVDERFELVGVAP